MPESNKKTTVWGVVAAIGAICIGAAAALDGDPETIVDSQAITAAVGALITAVGVLFGGKASKDK